MSRTLEDIFNEAKTEGAEWEIFEHQNSISIRPKTGMHFDTAMCPCRPRVERVKGNKKPIVVHYLR